MTSAPASEAPATALSNPPPAERAHPAAFSWVVRFGLVWCVFLLAAGGFTTSIDAGMAFLDWPLSNGSVNPEGWTENPQMAAEHSHRLLGAKLGLLAMLLCAWAWLRALPVLVRGWATAFLVLVVAQGLLGGLRVLLDNLNTGADDNTVATVFRVAHALGAQVTVLSLVALAVVSSRTWAQGFRVRAGAPDRWLAAWGWAAVGAVVVQVLLGAVMRHLRAGALIHTFPWSTPEGGWLPAFWNVGMAFNFAHRVWALVVTALVAVFLWRLVAGPLTRRWWPHAAGLAALLTLQIVLGVVTSLTLANAHAATTHHLVGSIFLAWLGGLTFLAGRLARRPPEARSA